MAMKKNGQQKRNLSKVMLYTGEGCSTGYGCNYGPTLGAGCYGRNCHDIIIK